MNGVNLRRFHFDYDTTWAAFFLDETLNVYSRYGGRDKREPEARMNKSSLLQTMQEVLNIHAAAVKKPQAARQKLVQPMPDEEFRPHDMPLLKRSHQGCVHCHQVREYQLLQAFHDGKFQRRHLFEWPLPENLGLENDLKHGHRIRKVAAASPAAKSGLRAGDVITRVNKIPVHSDYDIRWALARTKEKSPIAITFDRTGNPGDASTKTVLLTAPAHWRETELGWRKSLRSVPLPFGFRGYALTRSQRKELGISEDRLAVRLVSVRDDGLSGNLALKRKDTIVAVGDSRKHRTLEELKSLMLRRYKSGDTITITVLREGKRRTLTGRFPAWKIAETSVP